MLLAVVQNEYYGTQVVWTSLGLGNIESICEATMISSFQNKRHSLEIFDTLVAVLSSSCNYRVTNP